MAETCLQSGIHGDFVTLDEASALSGLSIRAWCRRAEVHARKGLAYKAPPPDGNGKPVWYVSRVVDPRLTRNPSPPTREERTRAALLAAHPAHLVELAYRKAYWLRQWLRAIAAGGLIDGAAGLLDGAANQLPPLTRGGLRGGTQRPAKQLPPFTRGGLRGGTSLDIARHISTQAKRVEGDDFPISPRSLQAWRKAYNELGPNGQIRGVEALVPKYRGTEGRRDRGTENPHSRSAEAVAYFYGIYHSEGQQTVRTCHDATLAKAPAEGWSWPASYSATCQWLRKHDDLAESCLRRDGRSAYSRRYMPHLERDWTTVEPGEVYMGDHTQLDCWVEHNGKLLRPWLTTFLDCRSRCVVGWHIAVSPHQDGIMAALRMAFTKWAIPQRLYVDQGKDFCSELLTGVTKKERRRLRRELGEDWPDQLRHQHEVFWLGIAEELGIAMTFAIPYHPWAKGIVERFYGSVHDRHDRSHPTYCGRDPQHRPECLPRILAGHTGQGAGGLQLNDGSAVPTLNEVRTSFTDFVDAYHARPHSGDGMQGQTPRAVWATAPSLRQAVEDELLPLMQARGVFRVGGNGVSFLVAGRRQSYGAGSAALRNWRGRDVLITIDEQDCGCCYAYTPEREHRVFIARLESNARIPANATVEELREGNRTVQRRRQAYNRAAVEAPKRMRTAAGEVAALRQAQAIAARATGTEDHRPPRADIVPVRTGFDHTSSPVRTDFEPDSMAPYAAVDLTNVSLAPGNAEAEPEADIYADLDLTTVRLGDS